MFEPTDSASAGLSGRRVPRRRLAAPRWLAPLVLVLVATTQMVLSERVSLNPWTAGGFGMFSTVDHLQTRRVRVWRDDGRPVVLAPDLRDASRIVRTLPSPQRIRRFAEQVAESTGERVRVEVIRLAWDAEQRVFHVRLIGSAWGERR